MNRSFPNPSSPRGLAIVASAFLPISLWGGARIAGAQERQIVGSRAAGMGGAAVAAVADESAICWNPAVLGLFGAAGGGTAADGSQWRRRGSFSVGIQAHGDVQAFNDVGQAVEDLVNIGQSGGGSIGSVQEALELVAGLATEKWAAAALADTSVLVRIGALGFGYRASAEVAGIPRPTIPLDQIDPATIDPNNLPVELVYEGLILHELPIAYGYAPTDWLSIGLAAKYLYGETLVSRTAINQVDPNDYFGDVFDELIGSSDFGLDLGVAVHVDWFEAGLTARNLTSPSFDLSSLGPVAGLGHSLTLEPELRLGLAVHPLSTVTVALDFDLLRRGALLDDLLKRGYEVQYLSLGAEWTPFEVLALRLGYIQNVAESDLGPEMSAGLGCILGPVNIDLAGQFAFGSSDLNAYTIPEELRVGLTIGFTGG